MSCHPAGLFAWNSVMPSGRSRSRTNRATACAVVATSAKDCSSTSQMSAACFYAIGMPSARRSLALGIVGEVVEANEVRNFRWHKPHATVELCCTWDAATAKLCHGAPLPITRLSNAHLASRVEGRLHVVGKPFEAGELLGRVREALEAS